MAKKVIKKMQDGGPVPIPTKKTNPIKEALGREAGKKSMGKPLSPPKSTNDSITKKPSKSAPKDPYLQNYMEKGDNGKLYKKGGSVKKK